MNKQIDKQTNKQTTKLDDIHNIHIKMLYILWERESVCVCVVRRCFDMSTIGHIRIVWTCLYQEYSIGKSTGYCINTSRLIVRDWIVIEVKGERRDYRKRN